MADVTGDLGGQPIQLNNAATEATLKQLVQAIGILSAKSGKGAKSQAQLEKELKKFQEQLDKSTKKSKENNKELEEEAKKRKELADRIAKEDAARALSERRTIAGVNAVRGFTQALEGGVTGITSLMSQLAGMGNSFSGAASIFNNIPLVGGMLGSVFGAIAQSGDKVFNTFKQSASVGANFNGSIRDLVNAASGAGLTMDQFAAIVQKNGENLALLGGSATEGAKRLADAAKAIRKSGVGDDLARLGYSTEDISNGMARFGGMMARSGKQLDQSQLVKSTGDYLKQLDAVARLTGKNKEALQAEADARMADSQYRLMLAKLDPEGAANLETLMASIPKEHQAGLKEIIATGTAVSDEAIAAMAFMNKTGQNAMQLGEAMRQSGTLTKQQMFAFDDARRSEMRTMADEAKTRGGVINTIGNFGDTVQQKLVVGVLDAAGQTKNLRETIAEQDKELKNATKNQKEALDPAAMQRMQQTIAETSNKMTVLLAENLPKLSSAFDQLMKIINDYVVPAFRFLMDHFGAIVGTVVAFKGALALASAAAKAFELYKNVAGPGTNPAKPMWVKDVSGGGVGGGGDLGGGKGKGKVPGKGIGKMAKGFGAVGAVISAGMLVSDLSDIDEQEKAGNITSGESKEAKGGAVGSAVGGAGGAWAGAAAGAAIGSVVPVVGTVIGGAIGAALGGWLGSNAGEIAGKELTKAVVAAPKEGSQDWLKVNDKNINSWVDAVHEGRVKMEQVPGVYMPYVKERIAKKPVKATATSATEAAKPATAGGVNYKAGAEDLLKQFVAANGSVPAQLKDQRAVSNVNDAQKSLAAEAEKKAQAEKEKAEAEKKALEEKSKKPSTTQESSETLLASLNTNMGQLVKLMKDQNSLSENQLSATKSLTGDLFASVG